MDESSSVTAWVVGAIIVLLVIAGVWWAIAANNSAGIPNTGTQTPTNTTTY